jgi:hypothetical protein
MPGRIFWGSTRSTRTSRRATFCGFLTAARPTVLLSPWTTPDSSWSGWASRRNVTFWPSATRPASASSTSPFTPIRVSTLWFSTNRRDHGGDPVDAAGRCFRGRAVSCVFSGCVGRALRAFRPSPLGPVPVERCEEWLTPATRPRSDPLQQQRSPNLDSAERRQSRRDPHKTPGAPPKRRLPRPVGRAGGQGRVSWGKIFLWTLAQPLEPFRSTARRERARSLPGRHPSPISAQPQDHARPVPGTPRRLDPRL